MLTIKMKLKDLVKNDRLLEQTGINPYCINEGADPEEYKEVEVDDVVITNLK